MALARSLASIASIAARSKSAVGGREVSQCRAATRAAARQTATAMTAATLRARALILIRGTPPFASARWSSPGCGKRESAAIHKGGSSRGKILGAEAREKRWGRRTIKYRQAAAEVSTGLRSQ